MNLSLSGVFLISMIGFCQADMLTILAKLGEYLRAPKPLPLHYNATLESKVTLAKRIAQQVGRSTINFRNILACSATGN